MRFNSDIGGRIFSLRCPECLFSEGKINLAVIGTTTKTVRSIYRFRGIAAACFLFVFAII